MIESFINSDITVSKICGNVLVMELSQIAIAGLQTFLWPIKIKYFKNNFHSVTLIPEGKQGCFYFKSV